MLMRVDNQNTTANHSGRSTPLILVVDDDPFIREMLTEGLEVQGYHVLTAANGKEALSQFATHHPDLVVLDLLMPVMDGFESCVELRRAAEGQPLPIITLSGEESPDAIQKSFEAGATDYCNKPVRSVLLWEKIRQLLHARDTELALADNRNKLSHSQRLAGMGYWEYNSRTGELSFSPELVHLFGLSEDAQINNLFRFLHLVPRDDRKAVTSVLRTALDEHEPYAIEHRMTDNDGVEYVVQHQGAVNCTDEGGDCQLTATIIDVTRHHDAQQLIESQIFHDMITGLPNRTRFTERLSRYMAMAEQQDQLLGVLFIGIDRFKNINDSLGHSIGDILLQQFAKRLTGIDEQIALVSRFSGDIFSLVVERVTTVDEIETVIERILAAFREPFRIDDNEFYLSVSIGCAIHPLSNDNREQLIKSADAAMYQAKQAGGNRYVRYDAEIDTKVSRRLTLENSLRKALEREEFTVHYQPQVAVHNGRIVGMEALVRWERPGFGLVPPDVFIPIAEETGLIVPIGSWVLRTAAAQAASWYRKGYGMLRLGVNLSPRQFEEPNLVEEVEQVLTSTGLPACCLDLEITESSAMQNIDQTIEILNRLKALGTQSSMDDFGTGYSSLSQLNRMPLHTLKIDRVFIMNITDDGENSDLARIIILMCHALGLNVIAEGVETEGQMRFLLQHHCSEAQGYHISRPLPADKFELLLQAEHARNAQERQAAELTLF